MTVLKVLKSARVPVAMQEFYLRWTIAEFDR
jgi:hypothetical protein